MMHVMKFKTDATATEDERCGYVFAVCDTERNAHGQRDDRYAVYYCRNVVTDYIGHKLIAQPAEGLPIKFFDSYGAAKKYYETCLMN